MVVALSGSIITGPLFWQGSQGTLLEQGAGLIYGLIGDTVQTFLRFSLVYWLIIRLLLLLWRLLSLLSLNPIFKEFIIS